MSHRRPFSKSRAQGVAERIDGQRPHVEAPEPALREEPVEAQRRCGLAS
jgi:hypothetical protein